MPLDLRSVESATKNRRSRRFVHHLVDDDVAPEPGMKSIQNFSANNPVGVLKLSCTTGDDRIRALTTAPRIKPTSIFLRSARRPNPGRRSTYRRGIIVQTTGTGSPTQR
jgi:hypothetical protein